MKDGQPNDQFPIVLERKHVEALLNPESVHAELRQEARTMLSRVLASSPIDNPREAGGAMIDTSNDPHARGQVMFDTRRAVLLEAIEAAVAHTSRKGVPVDMVAFQISGRINRPSNVSGERPAERVSYLNMMDWDGAADIIVELQALAARAGFDLTSILKEKWAAFEAQGFTDFRG